MSALSALYIEEACREWPRVVKLRQQCADLPQIACKRYGEVFNRSAQDFRLQKMKPGLVLAKKHKGLVLPAPAGYGFGKSNSYYFSHMLNCPYDCRYCFLQGMYRSAHILLFVNYEDFEDEIKKTILQCGAEKSYFYSGYDSDSLAFESYSGFAAHFVPFFKQHPSATLELRTKSAQIKTLLALEASDNIVVAMSFSPEAVAEKLEHHTPSFSKRIAAAKKLQEAGWTVALRFEPLVYHPHFVEQYQSLFDQIFSELDSTALHSVSLGLFRMPQTYFKNIVKLYPDEPLFANPYDTQDGMVSYPKRIEDEMIKTCESLLFEHIPKSIYYRCAKKGDALCEA